MKVWTVCVDGYDDHDFIAETAPAAKYKAYRAFCEAFGRQTFRDFLGRGVRVHEARGPWSYA